MQQITKMSVIQFYLEYVNNYLTIERMAEHYDMPIEDCKYLIELGKKYNEELAERLSKIPVEYGKENKAWS